MWPRRLVLTLELVGFIGAFIGCCLGSVWSVFWASYFIIGSVMEVANVLLVELREDRGPNERQSHT
jgi:hypothetical protein